MTSLPWHGVLTIGGRRRSSRSAGRPRDSAAAVLRGEMSETGPASVGVPGAPAGYLALAERGRLPLARLAAPAIQLAQDGFCWSRICSQLSEESADLVARYNVRGTRYFPDNQSIAPGTVIGSRAWRPCSGPFVTERGGFLAGSVGQAIVACVRQHGGVLTSADLATAFTAEWVAAAEGSLGELPLFVTPAPTHGPSLLRAMSRINATTQQPVAAIYQDVLEAIAWQRRDLRIPAERRWSRRRTVKARWLRSCIPIPIRALAAD